MANVYIEHWTTMANCETDRKTEDWTEWWLMCVYMCGCELWMLYIIIVHRIEYIIFLCKASSHENCEKQKIFLMTALSCTHDEYSINFTRQPETEDDKFFFLLSFFSLSTNGRSWTKERINTVSLWLCRVPMCRTRKKKSSCFFFFCQKWKIIHRNLWLWCTISKNDEKVSHHQHHIPYKTYNWTQSIDAVREKRKNATI